VNELGKIIERTIDHFGQLDVLVNNAADPSCKARIYDANAAEEFERTLAVNLNAPYRLSNLASAHLIKTKGSIINVSSVHSNRAVGSTLNSVQFKIGEE